MSYDGWIEVDGQEVAEIGNHTSNTSRMWRWCLSMVCESPVRLADTDGWPCAKAAPILEKAVGVMAENRVRLSEWNPSNGWGTYDSALEYLRKAARQTSIHQAVPGAVLRWDW